MKLFIIDDDQFSMFITESMLLSEGAVREVQCFTSAADALRELQEGSGSIPDVMLLDLNMPLMDGWHFLEALTKNLQELQGNCSIYVLTSSLDPADEARSQEYSLVAGFIRKPIRAEDIQAIAQRHYGGSRQ